MQTAISQLRTLMAARDWHNALRMAAKFPRLGEHKAAIERGWAAKTDPGIYREMGQDPDVLIALGIRALQERYP